MHSLCNRCVVIARNSSTHWKVCGLLLLYLHFYKCWTPQAEVVVQCNPTSVLKPSHCWFVCCTPCVRRPGRYARTSGFLATRGVGSIPYFGILIKWTSPMFFACDVELGGKLPLSFLTTLSGLVVPSPSAAARDTPVPSSVLPGCSHCLPESVTAD